MKTKDIILLFMFFIPFLVNGQNHFVDGMTWRTRVCGTHDPEAKESIEVVSIEKGVDNDCFNMYRSYEDNAYDREFIAVIKNEGSKVYFNPAGINSSEWYLLYDFGLKPGEGCFVYCPLAISEDSKPYKTYVKCLCIDEKFNEDWDVLRLEEYTDDSCTTMIGNGSWIRGLSSVNGVLYNNRFEDDGFGSVLLDVRDNERIIYSNSQSGILETTDIASVEVKIDGLEISISVDDDVYGCIYSQTGLNIGEFRFSKTPTCIKLSNRGIYILR
ncbi:MAG: hypothetical protein K2I48_01195, partial [Muribaculaceae bacterium]|nr:hypothetical protein [Muribaculaceae bacterium]